MTKVQAKRFSLKLGAMRDRSLQRSIGMNGWDWCKRLVPEIHSDVVFETVNRFNDSHSNAVIRKRRLNVKFEWWMFGMSPKINKKHPI